jgi:signal transduction histidine kinase
MSGQSSPLLRTLPGRRAPAGDDRVRAAGAVLSGEPVDAVAERHGVSGEQVLTWAQALQSGGTSAVADSRVQQLPSGPYAAGVAVQDYVALLANDLAAPLAQAASALAEDSTQARLVARASVAHALRLTEQLGDALAVATGQVDLQPQGVDLLGVVRDACRRFGLAAPAEGSDAAVVEADPTRLRQIVDALLGDVLQHVGSDDIAVGVRSLGSALLLTVRLAGVSLSLAPGSATPVARGEGLALYVARALVLASGGKIGVTGHGEPGDTDRATVLWVRLPVAPPSAPDDRV